MKFCKSFYKDSLKGNSKNSLSKYIFFFKIIDILITSRYPVQMYDALKTDKNEI